MIILLPGVTTAPSLTQSSSTFWSQQQYVVTAFADTSMTLTKYSPDSRRCDQDSIRLSTLSYFLVTNSRRALIPQPSEPWNKSTIQKNVSSEHDSQLPAELYVLRTIFIFTSFHKDEMAHTGLVHDLVTLRLPIKERLPEGSLPFLQLLIKAG